MFVTSKLPEVKTTIFTIMSALAKKHQAINLSQGFPDFSPHPKLIEAATKAMLSGQNQYAPMQGLMNLREIIAQKTQELYNVYYNPEKEITVTAGATQAIFTAIMAFIRPQDEVIMIEPVYDSYLPAVRLCGGMVKFCQMNPDDFSINWKDMSKLISNKTKAIIINSPHNPTGSTLKEKDLQELQKLVQGTDIVVISDEVYEHIIFDGEPHQSVALYPELAQRSIIVSSFGKTYHTTGWKVGYVLAPENLMVEFQKVHQYNVFSVNIASQAAFAEILKDKDLYLSLGQFYQEKRNYFRNLLQGSRFELKPVSGAYFQLASYQKISEEKDTDFAIYLTEKVGVAPIPLSPFYSKQQDFKLLRFCFAKENETLEKAAAKLMKV
ncbi:MAG: methionine aminotransferase [Raineya sp.]|jgi:methionine aminotransferase|nr:methionine aminotransferase [Raineya sp.]